MASSASTYISKINAAYPVPGVDNDTQGFRDNFKNIKLALDATDQDVDNLKINGVTLTNPVNNFNDNIIKQAQFQDCSVTVYDVSGTIETGDVEIDYTNGSYQKFTVEDGIHWFSVVNWPGNNQAGALTISITTSTTSATTVNFSAGNVYNLGQNTLPVDITNKGPVLFHLWSDGSGSNLYVKQVNHSNKFSNPLTLATYSTSTLSSLGSVDNGSMVFVSTHNRPAYHYNGVWYLMTGTALTL